MGSGPARAACAGPLRDSGEVVVVDRCCGAPQGRGGLPAVVDAQVHGWDGRPHNQAGPAGEQFVADWRYGSGECIREWYREMRRRNRSKLRPRALSVPPVCSLALQNHGGLE